MTSTAQLPWWVRWRFVLPALLWTLAFFIVPFVYMLIMSLWQRVGRQIIPAWNLDNYIEFFGKPHLLKALINSLEISFTVTLMSVLLAYPLADPYVKDDIFTALPPQPYESSTYAVKAAPATRLLEDTYHANAADNQV